MKGGATSFCRVSGVPDGVPGSGVPVLLTSLEAPMSRPGVPLLAEPSPKFLDPNPTVSLDFVHKCELWSSWSSMTTVSGDDHQLQSIQKIFIVFSGVLAHS
jgi:hypothetical protein